MSATVLNPFVKFLKIYVFFNIVILIVNSLIVLEKKSLIGDFLGFGNYENIYLVASIIISIIEFILLYLLIFIFVKYNFTLYRNKKICIKFNYTRLTFLIMILLILNILYLSITGVGILNRPRDSSLSFLFAILMPDLMFYIYYLSFRELKIRNLVFIINTILFVFFKILQGWTGFILFFAWCEFYFFIKRMNKALSIRHYVFIIIFVFIILLGGSLVYYVLFPVKMFIRNGVWLDFSFYDSFIMLVGRLHYYSNIVASLSSVDFLTERYNLTEICCREIISLFRPITPRFIFTNKEFNILANFVNLINWEWYEEYIMTSVEIGIFTHLIILFIINKIEFLFYVVFSILLLIVIKIFFDPFFCYLPDSKNFFYFTFLSGFIRSPSLEVSFSSYLHFLIYIVPILTLLNIIKYKIINSETRFDNS